jgi:methylamine methyltransferase corrinoid protein reductive activase
MSRYGIALDLGTSGYRTHLVDLDRKGKIISTSITMRHPLPGANIMDHLHFWMENGAEAGHQIITETVDELIGMHGVDPKEIGRMAICGNPAQLSMFENIEIRDLAYAGQNILARLEVKVPERRSHIRAAGDLGLSSVDPEAEIRCPPSVRHEIGADALAMIIKSHLLGRKETCMVTDYGTNAEMGLYKDGELWTGSAAAGPAMEGQSIEFGMLAAPMAISDISLAQDGLWRNHVLDEKLRAQPSGMVDPRTGEVRSEGSTRARGITGTGVVAIVATGLEAGIISLPDVMTEDKRIHLQDGMYIDEHDVREAGKAMGAIRAGHRTLIEEVGIDDEDVASMYLAGASGTYVDPLKAQTCGLVPRVLERTYQCGNTSLMMAYDLLVKDECMDEMQGIADSLAARHIMFATSKVFEDLYVNEIAYWLEGMPMDLYNRILAEKGYRPLPQIKRPKETLRIVSADIPVLGDRGLRTLDHVGVHLVGDLDGCTGCKKCVHECPERALTIEKAGKGLFRVRIATEYCLGTACKKCERVCPEGVMAFSDLRVMTRSA